MACAIKLLTSSTTNLGIGFGGKGYRIENPSLKKCINLCLPQSTAQPLKRNLQFRKFVFVCLFCTIGISNPGFGQKNAASPTWSRQSHSPFLPSPLRVAQDRTVEDSQLYALTIENQITVADLNAVASSHQH